MQSNIIQGNRLQDPTITYNTIQENTKHDEIIQYKTRQYNATQGKHNKSRLVKTIQYNIIARQETTKRYKIS